MRFHIPNMNCGGCARGVTRAIEALDADARVAIDQPRREAEVTTGLPPERVAAALAAAGFPATPVA